MQGTQDIRLLIVDDHPLVREGLVGLLQKAPGIQVVGQADTCAQGWAQVTQLRPQVVLLDVSLPDDSGLALARKIKAQGPACKILFLSMHLEEEFLAQAFAAGGDGYLIKSSHCQEIVEGIMQVAQGKRFVSAALGKTSAGPGPMARYPEKVNLLADVTERELEVLNLVALGMSAKEVAQTLNISHRTVETHRANLMRKLGAKNSVELVRLAANGGIINK